MLTTASPAVDEGPRIIRLFNPEGTAPPKNTRILNPGVLWNGNAAKVGTLRECFEQLIRPDIQPDQLRTLEGYESALKHWERRTANPPADRIGDDEAREFRRSMEADPKIMSPETIKKQWRYLAAILRAAQRKGLVKELPRIGRLDSVSDEIRIVSDRELDALYQACESATWPRLPDVSAVDWWRCAIVLLRLYGQRFRELTSQPWRGTSKRAGETPPGVYDQPECPSSKLRSLGLANRWGWYVYTPPKQRRHKPAPLFLPLHRVARWHLDRVRSDRDKVLPMSLANKSLHAQWTRLLDEAGIPETDRFTRHDIRRTCETVYDEHCGGIGSQITGHAKRSVSDRFYSSYARRICKAVRKVPLPASFLACIAEDERQKKLF